MTPKKVNIIGKKRELCIKELRSFTLYLIKQIHIHGGFTDYKTVEQRIMLDHCMSVKFRLEKEEQLGIPSFFFLNDLPTNIKALISRHNCENDQKVPAPI